jgi:hypothetical protein
MFMAVCSFTNPFARAVHQPVVTNYFLRFRCISILMYHLWQRALSRISSLQERSWTDAAS